MCGIVGVAGKVWVNQEKAFTDLLVMDTLRGSHSTGVLRVAKDGTASVLKKAVNGFDFVDMKQYTSLLAGSHQVLLGHNRYATQGKINAANAHPFTHEHITGVHNGTLRGQYLLPDHQKFTVDSDNLIYTISKQGIESAWAKTNGAAALVWWDEDKESLNFIRNSERTLFYTMSKDGETLYWASEEYMLAAALDRRDLAHGEIEPFIVDHHYTWTVNHAGTSCSISGKPRIRKLQAYVPAYTPPSGFGNRYTPPANRSSSSTTVTKGGNVTALPKPQTTSAPTKSWLDQHGLAVGGSVDFVPLERDGWTIFGVTLCEESHDVIIHASTKEIAEEAMNRTCSFWRLNRITGAVGKTPKFPDGAIVGQLLNINFIIDEDDDKDVPADVCDAECVMCMQPMSTTEKGAVQMDHETFLCGDCSGQPASVHAIS